MAPTRGPATPVNKSQRPWTAPVEREELAPGNQPNRVTITREIVVPYGQPTTAPEALTLVTGLSKLRIKDAMQKGAVWLQNGTRKPQRLRRITTPLAAGDRLSIYYDSAVLNHVPPTATLVADHKRYSVWHKPAGLLVEGSRYGDHATLARQISEHFEERREVLLVHRLDMEASGLVVAAHSSGACAKLAALWQERQVDKRYRVTVRGDLRPRGPSGRISQALDGKSAVTDWLIESYDAGARTTTLHIRMLSGRFHQIRRHLESIGTPVLGDPRYGQDNKDAGGLRLAAIGIAYQDPWTNAAMTFGECPAFGSPPAP